MVLLSSSVFQSSISLKVRAGKKTVFYMSIEISKIFLQEMEKVEALLLYQIPLKVSLVDILDYNLPY